MLVDVVMVRGGEPIMFVLMFDALSCLRGDDGRGDGRSGAGDVDMAGILGGNDRYASNDNIV